MVTLNSLVIFAVCYALVGLVCFEWAWWMTKRLRIPNEERDSKYPAFRRLDTWRKWRYYPGAMLLLPFNMIYLGLLFAGMGASHFIILLGHDFKGGKNKMMGFRRKIHGKVLEFFTSKQARVYGLRWEVQNVDYDYSFYLGEGYKEKQKIPKNPANITVTGHCSLMDYFFMLGVNSHMSVVAKSLLSKAPVINLALRGLNTYYINRAGTKAEKDAFVRDIAQRSIECEEADEGYPDMIFPEGCTHNNKYILPFKRGAFAALRSCMPIILNYRYKDISPSAEIGFNMGLQVLMWSMWHSATVDIIQLPIFIPNDYLFETHKDKGNEKWEIYAWALREIMSKVSGKPQIEVQVRDKQEFELLLQGKKPRVKKE